MKKHILAVVGIMSVVTLLFGVSVFVKNNPLRIDENAQEFIKLEGYGSCSILKFTNKKIEPIEIECSVTESEINTYIQNELSDNYSRTKIINRNKIEIDDLAVADYTVMDGTVKIGETKDALIRVGSGYYDVFLENKILGLNKNKEYVLDWNVPSNHENREWAGKKLKIFITIKELYKIETPSLEEYVRQIGVESVEEYKNQVKEKLLNEKKNMLLTQGVERALDSFIATSKFKMDEDVVVENAFVYYQNYQKLAEVCGEDVEGYINLGDENEDVYLKCYNDSEREIQRYFVIGKLAYNMGMSVTKENVESYCKEKNLQYDSLVGADKVRVRYAILEKKVLEEIENEYIIIKTK